MNRFYYSWSKQDAPVDFPVASAEHDQFVLHDGRRIYDFVSTSFQANFGHNQARISEKIVQQLSSMPVASPKATFELKQSVSQRLDLAIGLEPGKIFYTVSGAETVENALKIARQLTGRKTVLARQKSYHGATLGALSVTGDWRNGHHMTFDEGTLRIPEYEDDPDLTQTRKIVSDAGPDSIAAIILETISGTNGVSIPTKAWFEGIQELCQEFGILLILDEVLVGFGRCGPMFAFQDFDLKPDMVCMSKAITGGYIPFGALWTSPAIAARYNDDILACGLTNYGHPLGLAALDGVLDLLSDPDLIRQKEATEKILGEYCRQMAQENRSVVEIRQRGSLVAIYLDRPAPSWQTAFDAGLHLYSRDNLSILAPPYNTDPQRLQSALDTYFRLLD